ncbi:methyltransferase domain-containing protein [Magnetospira sp. QH-2]|uniref:methyltransferase domain-containing protein n=1 Tax=Magnetospira sp. (strain QH-2) TaxID=1288970 RepID=UPI0003E80B52|nr:methyltransferase domain-containing protein [Magnetospira sp. QH-2]CCQ72117.1 Trans-aconitate 2-methyltransferase [Magnetospira sp. QH-2]
MSTWDPEQYLRHASARLRPAVDLLARVGADSPDRVMDLGCGTGISTRLLSTRWPGARVTGLDNSPRMLAKARAEGGDVDWVEGDAGTWSPDRPVDLLFSNAVLHWLPDHGSLLPKMMSFVAPGGWLAIQMPRFGELPAHKALAMVADSALWEDQLADAVPPSPVLSISAYYDLLSPLGKEPDIWETEYQHVLAGEDPVLDWVMGTAMRPYLSALTDPEDQAAFVEQCRGALAAAYPPQSDGRTLLPFRRIFIVVEKQ